MKTRTKLLAVILPCICLYQYAIAQVSVEDAMSKKHPDCRDVLLNAIDLIPKYYREKAFDSVQKVVDIWETSCGNTPEAEYTKVLLSIERSVFNNAQPDSSLVELLISYSYAYKNYSRYPSYYGPGTSSYYKLSSTWAKFLLERTNLSVTEKFVCDVFTGNISDPVKEIKSDKEVYAVLYNLLNTNLQEQKKSGSAEYTIVSGVWVPTGNVAVLGVHPSIGLQFGGRFDRHQVDLSMQIRFLNSAGTYTVKRNNTLYDLDYYFGGYIGLDYNYYFINSIKTDLGLLGGIGYDGFDIAASGDSHENDYLKPLSISSLNLNAGLRFNYVFSSSFYLGLQGRYNFMNYGTKGGSNLNGDAFSFDLIFGFTSRSSNNHGYYKY